MIEIISHCFGPKYASLLNYHLSSLVLNETRKTTVVATIIYIAGDHTTEIILEYFKKIDRPWIRWNFIPMTAQMVYQRPIGRNITARLTNADIVWFADCDHMFGDNCLDTLYPFPGDGIYYPNTLLACGRRYTIHAINTIIKCEMVTPNILDIDKTQFTPISIKRAIGGLQIVSGDIARKYGYLPDDEKWQHPLKKYSRDDGSAFWRDQLITSGVTHEKFTLPNLYRF